VKFITCTEQFNVAEASRMCYFTPQVIVPLNEQYIKTQMAEIWVHMLISRFL